MIQCTAVLYAILCIYFLKKIIYIGKNSLKISVFVATIYIPKTVSLLGGTVRRYIYMLPGENFEINSATSCILKCILIKFQVKYSLKISLFIYSSNYEKSYVYVRRCVNFKSPQLAPPGKF